MCHRHQNLYVLCERSFLEQLTKNTCLCTRTTYHVLYLGKSHKIANLQTAMAIPITMYYIIGQSQCNIQYTYHMK